MSILIEPVEEGMPTQANPFIDVASMLLPAYELPRSYNIDHNI